MNPVIPAEQLIYAQTGPSSERVRVCAKHGCGNLLFAPDVSLCGSCSGLDMELGYPEDTAQASMPAFETRALEAGYYASAPNTYRQDDSWLHTNRPHVIQNYYHPSMYNARRAYAHSPMISSPLNPRREHRMSVKRPVSTSYNSFSPHPWHSPPSRRPMDVDDRPLSLAPVLHCTTLGCYNFVNSPGMCKLCLSKEEEVAIDPPSVAGPLNMARGACKQSCLSGDKTRSKPQKTVMWADFYEPRELEIPVIGEEVDLLESRQADTKKRKLIRQSHFSKTNVSGGPHAPVSDPLKGETSSKSHSSESIPVPSPPATPNKTVVVSGWDSDLSELTSSASDESDSNDSKPLAQCIRRPERKLVIRIPSMKSRAMRLGSQTAKEEDSSRLRLRKCVVPHCSVLLPPYPPGNQKVRSRKREDLNGKYYPWKCCPKCRERCREYARRKKGPMAVDKNPDVRKTLYTLPHPVYRCLVDLLADFEERLDDFLCAKEVVARHRVPQAFPGKRTAFRFTFDGQFSVVSADLNVLPRAGKVMGRIKQALEERSIRLNNSEEVKDQALAISDSPHLSTVLEGGVVRRYRCLHICWTAAGGLRATLEESSRMNVDIGQTELGGEKSTLGLRGARPTSGGTRHIAPLGNLLVTKMVGEVEIMVLSNTSHRIYPGETVVVRLELVG